MTTIQDVCNYLDRYAPRRLAEDWDNVGLLVGKSDFKVERVMTCLTITRDSANEAVGKGADLIVTHHPLPFRPLKRITWDTLPGRLLLSVIQNRIAVVSPHTAFDSASRGINQRLAEGLRLVDPAPLVPLEGDPDGLGAGRVGFLPRSMSVGEVATELARLLDIDGLMRVGDAGQGVKRVAVACGAAGQFLADARREGCQLLVTGETNFHTCLEAEADNIALLLPGHYASERFAVEALAVEIATEFPELEVWPSAAEHDPLAWHKV